MFSIFNFSFIFFVIFCWLSTSTSPTPSDEFSYLNFSNLQSGSFLIIETYYINYSSYIFQKKKKHFFSVFYDTLCFFLSPWTSCFLAISCDKKLLFFFFLPSSLRSASPPSAPNLLFWQMLSHFSLALSIMVKKNGLSSHESWFLLFDNLAAYLFLPLSFCFLNGKKLICPLESLFLFYNFTVSLFSLSVTYGKIFILSSSPES